MSDEADRIRTYQELARRGQAVPGKNFGTGVTPKTKKIEPKVKTIDTTKMKQIKLLELGGNVSKTKDKLAGVKMAMALDSQSEKDLAQLMKRAKKPRKIRTKPVKLRTTSNSIQKPGAFGIQRNDIMKARFGGKVVQKMQDGGAKLSQEELEAAIREIEEQGTVFGKGTELSKDQTKKIADKFESDFAKMFGKKYGGAIRKMRGGGLMEAIKKVQAKGMKTGGDPTEDVPKPKMRPESFKADTTESLDKDFSRKVAKTNKKNIENVKKHKYGGKVKKMRYGGSAKGAGNSCRGMGAAIRGGGYTIS